ncbi:MAG: hypothetical protein K6G52_03230 [Treponemataceae bacterium]|nr:hypothetical protein [Treponemataceae bacterium]
MNKAGKIIGITLGSIVGAIVGILVLLVLVITIGAHIKYAEFYKLTDNVAKNPGLFDNYIPQGLTFNDDENYFATCGYMKDHSQSRIYTVDKKTKKQHMYLLTSNGEPFLGHTGGLQYTNGNFYLASEGEGVFRFSASKLDGSKTLEIGPAIKVNSNSSFIFSDDEYIYVGEFARVPAYPCDHPFSFNGIEHTAIMTKYKIDDFENPVEIYSIPDEVQGLARTENGSMFLSRSWGLSFASYDFYKTSQIVKTDETMDGAPVYFLTEPSKKINSIYFAEDLDIVDGKFISLTEGASNKYYIGKFAFDYKIFSFDIDELEK